MEAPIDRRSQGTLTRGRFARGRAERVEAPVEPAQYLFRREDFDAGRRELDRERQSVQPSADLLDRTIRRECRIELSRASDEELPQKR